MFFFLKIEYQNNIYTSTFGVFLALVSSPAGCIEINNNYSKLHFFILTHRLFNFKEKDTYLMQTTHTVCESNVIS